MSGAENPMDTSSASGGFGVARFVAQQLLEIVPPKATAASVAVLASRSNMAIEHTRRHLRQLVTRGLVAVTKNGCGPRYYRPKEKTMAKTVDGRITGTDVLPILPERRLWAPLDLVDGDEVWIGAKRTKLVSRCNEDGGWRVDPPVDDLAMWNEDEMRMASVPAERDGMTVREIAEQLDADEQNVAAVLSYQHRKKRVCRDGDGGAKDPYRYFVLADGAEGDLTGELDDVDASAPPTGTSRVDAAAAASGKGVWPIVADQFDPPAGDDADQAARRINPDDAELAHCYAVVIDDVHRQRDVAQSDVDTLDAVAVVLARILDGAA